MKSENKLIKLYKKKPLINYSLNVLKKSKANKIIIVLGHQFKEVKKIIKEVMMSISRSEHHIFSIPLEVNVNSGYNWGEAH